MREIYFSGLMYETLNNIENINYWKAQNSVA